MKIERLVNEYYGYAETIIILNKLNIVLGNHVGNIIEPLSSKTVYKCLKVGQKISGNMPKKSIPFSEKWIENEYCEALEPNYPLLEYHSGFETTITASLANPNFKLGPIDFVLQRDPDDKLYMSLVSNHRTYMELSSYDILGTQVKKISPWYFGRDTRMYIGDLREDKTMNIKFVVAQYACVKIIDDPLKKLEAAHGNLEALKNRLLACLQHSNSLLQTLNKIVLVIEFKKPVTQVIDIDINVDIAKYQAELKDVEHDLAHFSQMINNV